jgi:hypothetical protein
MNLTKVDYQILLIIIVPIQRHYGHLTHNPQLWSVLVLKLTSTTPPHISVSADRGQSPLSVCIEDFVSYNTSSSWNLHWHTEVLIVFCQTFSVVLQYCGSCKNRPFMLIPTVGLRDQRGSLTQHISHQTKILSQHNSNQTNYRAISLTWYIQHTYIQAELIWMDGKITRCVRYRSATKTAQDFEDKEIGDFQL